MYKNTNAPQGRFESPRIFFGCHYLLEFKNYTKRTHEVESKGQLDER